MSHNPDSQSSQKNELEGIPGLSFDMRQVAEEAGLTTGDLRETRKNVGGSTRLVPSFETMKGDVANAKRVAQHDATGAGPGSSLTVTIFRDLSSDGQVPPAPPSSPVGSEGGDSDSDFSSC